jgi:hypothetical protein
MNLTIFEGIGSVSISFPAPPGGVYSAAEWAAAATLAISAGIQHAGSFDFGVNITLVGQNPTRFSWAVISQFPPNQQLRFDFTQTIATYLGLAVDRYEVFGTANTHYPGPLVTYPAERPVNTLHRIVVPAANYGVQDLVDALNAAIAPYPTLLEPLWTFDIDRIQVRLRDHAGHLLEIGHPGITLFLRVYLR